MRRAMRGEAGGEEEEGREGRGREGGMDTYKQWVKRNAHWLPAIMGLMEVRANTRDSRRREQEKRAETHHLQRTQRRKPRTPLTHPDALTDAHARAPRTTPRRAHERGRT